MAQQKTIGARRKTALPVVRDIGVADLRKAISKGVDDFLAKPSHLILIVLIYPIVGSFMMRATFGYDILPLLFPLIAGFTLIGPLAAVGLYEISRRREKGLEVSYWNAFDVLKSPSVPSIAAIGILQMVIYFLWIGAAQIIYNQTFGDTVPDSLTALISAVFTTPSGWSLLTVGSFVGFIFAAVVLSISVVSFPLLLDRDVGAIVAIQTSIDAFFANPMTMLLWGFIVAISLLLGCIPLFVGLAVVMPILGHTTWHIYRQVVAH